MDQRVLQAYADAQNELLAYQQETANQQVKIDKRFSKSKRTRDY